MGVVSSLHAIDISMINTCCKSYMYHGWPGVPDTEIVSDVRGHHTSKTFWTPAIGEQLTARPPGCVLINQY